MKNVGKYVGLIYTYPYLRAKPYIFPHMVVNVNAQITHKHIQRGKGSRRIIAFSTIKILKIPTNIIISHKIHKYLYWVPSSYVFLFYLLNFALYPGLLPPWIYFKVFSIYAYNVEVFLFPFLFNEPRTNIFPMATVFPFHFAHGEIDS